MRTAQKFLLVLGVLALLMAGSWYLGWRAGHHATPTTILMTPEDYFEVVTSQPSNLKTDRSHTMTTPPPPLSNAVQLTHDPFSSLSTDETPDAGEPTPPAHLNLPR